VSASDSFDNAADARTTTFNVDTETPWLKNPSVSPTSAGENDDITFLVVYCVYDYEGTGTPTVSVSIDGNNKVMDYFDTTSVCQNGIVYHLTDTVSWSESSHSVIFSAFNDNATAEDISGPSISINDAPILNDGTAERHFDDANFVLNVSASDVNSDDGDTFKVYATIEADSEREMTCDATGDCTLTVAEADIIDQRGGTRSVSFRVVDDNWGEEVLDGFSQTIEVTRTSSFAWVASSEGSFQPGLNGYDFEITNNGNSEDTFTVTAVSDSGWVASGSESQTVTVAKGVTETFTITMDVAHVAAGIVDYWSASITAGNDDTQTASHDGQTTVAVVSGRNVTIETSIINADPGATVTYNFTITNTGNDWEAFSYTTTVTPSSGTTNSLYMGESASILVSYTVPLDASAGTQSILIFSSGSKTASATTIINQIYGISFAQISIPDKPSYVGELMPGDLITFEYQFRNTGNGVDSAIITFDSDWLFDFTPESSIIDDLASGDILVASATLKVPVDAASGSNSSISVFIITDGGATANHTYDYNNCSSCFTVNSLSRSVSLSGSNSYTINKGESDEGYITITNEGVAATFVLTTASDSLILPSSVALAAGASGPMNFTIYAGVSGFHSFTITDTIDGFSESFTIYVEARVFSTDLIDYNIADCLSSNVVCEFDLEGEWDGSSYTRAGTWSTNMTVTDNWGLSGDKTFATVIPNYSPMYFSSPSVLYPTEIIGTKSYSFLFPIPFDSDGEITYLRVNFGDGNEYIVNIEGNITYESFADGEGWEADLTSIEHTYTSPGQYMITVTAYDNLGSSVTKHVEISVGDFTVTMDGNAINRHLGGLFLMLAFSIFVSVSSLSIHRSDVPEMLDEFEALLMEGIDNQEIRSAVKNLNSFQGIPMFSSSIDEYKELLSDSKELKSTIINKMVELGEIREEIYKMQDAGMSVKDLESVVHKLELQLAEQVEADTSVKYLETLQNKFVEGQEK
jgi:hypothetical protein